MDIGGLHIGPLSHLQWPLRFADVVNYIWSERIMLSTYMLHRLSLGLVLDVNMNV